MTSNLPSIMLSHPSGAQAEVHLQGAQVTSWIPANGHEMLYLSEAAIFEPAKPIRGGIPVVFPQFADTGPLPKHGWLRCASWEATGSIQEGDTTLVTLVTEDDEMSRNIWPHAYRAEMRITLGEESLSTELTILNRGTDAFTFTAALHTYLAVVDVTYAELVGLNGTQYIDKVAAGVMRTDRANVLRVTAETDRVYLGAPTLLRLIDCTRDTPIEIAASGFPDLVVWNPWKDRAAALPDMGDEDYLRMLCVEAALVANPHSLQPQQSWKGSQRLTVIQPERPIPLD
ncbi:MAG TPA: D-hexose-6-phosphate mutarotase [Gemmatimonadaceae bacterium]|nr:D-hexose-6-phosphate mutarotase [Gemmatimonadaceae bacterium]